MPTTTTTYSFNKPVVGADEDSWGGYLNGNWDSVDDLLDGTTPITGIDINSGTLDGVTIGGTTAGAGTFTNLTATGTTTLAGASTSADITFGDNNKAIFGAGSDLQIYHSGTSSDIDEVGTGNLRIGAENFVVQNADHTENMISATPNGQVVLYYDNSIKFNTSSTGVDIAGTLTSDGLTVDGAVDVNHNNITQSANSPRIDIMEGDTTDLNTRLWQTAGDLRIYTLTDDKTTYSERIRLDHATGDISFYEDTGTTPKFFWDASAESLGIGTSSPQAKLDVSDVSNFSVGYNTFSGDGLHIQCNGTGGNGAYAGGISFSRISSDNNSRAAGIAAVQTTADADQVGLAFFTHSSATTSADLIEAMRIDSSGNVGIGTTSASQKLHVQGDAQVNGYIFQNDGTNAIGLWGEGNADMRFGTNNVERMRIDSSGNVGIGTSSPNNLLTLNSNTANTAMTIQSSDTGGSAIVFGDQTDFSRGRIIYDNSDDSMSFETNNLSEAMRIDSSGNLLVGTTTTTLTTNDGIQLSSDGFLHASRDGNIAGQFNRITSDGDIVRFRKDGSTVGSIGVVISRPYIGNASNFGIRLASGGVGFLQPTDEDGAAADNLKDIGSTSARWDDIYATNGTIQTSDQNEKQDIAELSDAEQRVAVAAKGLLRKFRWKDKVAEKGDEARTHFGIIAQDLQAAFAAEGLDAGDYAMFIHTTWTDEETGEEKSRMGVRYSELLAFIIAAI